MLQDHNNNNNNSSNNSNNNNSNSNISNNNLSTDAVIKSKFDAVLFFKNLNISCPLDSSS